MGYCLQFHVLTWFDGNKNHLEMIFFQLGTPFNTVLAPSLLDLILFLSLNTSIAFCSLSIYKHASGIPKFLLISLLMFLYNFMPHLFQQAQGIFSNTLKKYLPQFQIGKMYCTTRDILPRLAIHFIWCSSH